MLFIVLLFRCEQRSEISFFGSLVYSGFFFFFLCYLEDEMLSLKGMER